MCIRDSSGSSGTSGTSGSSGSSGTSGTSGSSGTSGTSGTSGSSGTAGTSGTSGTGFDTIANPADYRILTASGSSTNSAIAQQNLTFDGNTLGITGDTNQLGNQYVHSAQGTSLSSGTHTIEQVLVVSGRSLQFDYVVYNGSQDSRAGTVIVVWNGTLATLTDMSTPDIGGPTDGIAFVVTNDGTNVTLSANVSSGTWNVIGGTRIIF